MHEIFAHTGALMQAAIPDETPPLSRAWDIFYVSPLIVLYTFVIAGLLQKLLPDIRHVYQRFDIVLALTVLQQLLTVAFAVLQIWLFLRRNLPARRSHGLWPQTVAVLGSNLGLVLLLLPRSTQSIPGVISSTLIIIVGLIASIHAIAWLGRCYAILPQVRGLVTAGPYRLVRHPLYLAELVTAFGVALQYREPWSMLLYGCTAVLQITRMHYEEKTLATAFPEYRDYAARTRRLMPGIY